MTAHALMCKLCPTLLRGGIDTFGSLGDTLCESCWLRIQDDKEASQDRAKQVRAEFSGSADPFIYADSEQHAPLPSEQFTCPDCKKPLWVEIREYESETGIPTEGGSLILCSSCGHSWIEHFDNVELGELAALADAWARENVRVRV